MIVSLLRRFLILIAAVSTANAHIVEQFYLSIEETGPEWQIDVTFDASYAFKRLRNDPNTPQPERSWLLEMSTDEHQDLRLGAKSYLKQAISFHHDGKATPFSISFPGFETTPPQFPELATGGAYLIIRLEGTIPEWQGGELDLAVSSKVRPNFILARNARSETNFEVIAPGESKAVFNLDRGRLAILWLGFRHVIPDGLDHIFLILALFLMVRKWRPLLAQSLSFTIAHSLSLALAVSGIISITTLPGAFLIEPLIALSIAALALENIFRKELQTKRLFIVFFFGLIHGLGFAGSLGAILQNEHSLLSSLILANLGVEFAQISVLALAWLVTVRWWTSTHYQKARLVASSIIAAFGIYWTIERLIT
ncbi:HupE/UreJ family protein [Akkermansiaceae bacterium]|nr:HupE/UreJ family protein [Akkermansiaceae bacterium]